MLSGSFEHQGLRDVVSKNATNDKIQSSRRFTDLFHLSLRTARHLTVVIVISFILSCYNFIVCDRIMFIGCKSKYKISFHQEKRRFFATFYFVCSSNKQKLYNSS